jgi:tRNA/rRNA methyltransferase
MNNCRVVLVRPKIAANIGATARAMRNFGASQLILVAPLADIADPRGRLLATQAQHILDNARIVNELDDAIADCVLVVGTSARRGGLFRQQSVESAQTLAPKIAAALASGPVAIVFGPETSGLTDAEITRFHYLLHIETAAEHAALNLAQAVAISLHEIRKAWQRDAPDPVEELAPFAMQEQMFVQLNAGLRAIHFLYGDKADALMHGIRHLLGKARLTPMEVKLLLGLARQLLWIAGQTEQETEPKE